MNFVPFSHSEALSHVRKSAGALLRSGFQLQRQNGPYVRLLRATALLAKRGDLPSALCLAPALWVMLAFSGSLGSERQHNSQIAILLLDLYPRLTRLRNRLSERRLRKSARENVEPAATRGIRSQAMIGLRNPRIRDPAPFCAKRRH